MRFFALMAVLSAAPAIAGTISPILLERIDSPPEISRFGQSVDVADLDRDGILDYAVGGSGLRVFAGKDGAILRSLNVHGDEVDFVGDLDGDGIPELVLGDVSQQTARIVIG